ncbi:competence type IV pilus major pilin ComGC [Planctomycetes bacterium K23_9]|uniref:Type II secretion system protein G n=1 Tax=Stieleria marina TaxID=1930275 RepID=A0A517P1S4_9BACT|nr:Type II secretion system protein G precursor [Planctomycetes bacterium K23_9]
MMQTVKKRSGFSLIEIIVTMTIMAILLSLTAPSVLRTMEQSHADMAGAGLRMVNTAQRFYWLENRTYAPNMQALIDAGLVDNDLNLTAPRYEFSITAADASSFQAQARRRQFDGLGQPVYNGAWQGNFTIDEAGTIVGSVQGNPSPIDSSIPVLTPAF